MEAIGGYFSLEGLGGRKENVFHKKAIPVNSGRNAFRLILQCQKIKHIVIPNYLCDVIVEPIKDLNINYSYYELNADLEVKYLNNIPADSHLLYINYFGLKSQYVNYLSDEKEKLIVDNSQAFYDRTHPSVATFYSPRKFFGVPGGRYAYAANLELNAETDTTYNQYQHQVIRADTNAEEGYETYQENEDKFNDRPLKKMAALTQQLLSNIDYEEVKKRRVENYSYLHSKLERYNNFFDFARSSYSCPLIYPFKNKSVSRKDLIGQRIYVPRYWPKCNDGKHCEGKVGSDLASNLIALPVDQRYGQDEMEYMVEVIKRYA